MKNSVLILLGLVLPLLAASQGTPWFNVAYSGNGNNHMTIYLTEDLVDNLGAGDEIGIFDGEICVGAMVLNAPVTGVVEVIASEKDDGLNNGFTNGNDIIIKVYDSGKEKEFGIVQAFYFDTEINPIEPVKFMANGSAFVKVAAYHPATISGPEGSILRYSTGNIYTTETDMTDYEWSVSGGEITSGNGTRTIEVTWKQAGNQTVSVNYKYPDSNIGSSADYNTIVVDRVISDIKVFLEGPYNNANGTMNSTLRPFIPLQQPYSSAPWSYNGTEEVVSIPANVVDWILVEMREADAPANATSATISARRAAFLLSNGSVVDLDGASPLQFLNVSVSEENNLYVVIWHRNHLSVMSANALIKNTNEVYEYDFSLENNIFGGATGYKVVGGKVVKVVGDANNDGTITILDYNLWASNFNTSGFRKADFNFDGSITVLDYNGWAVNFNKDQNSILKSASAPKYFSSVPE